MLKREKDVESLRDKITTCGGGKAPPYRAAETGKYPINPAWRAPLPGGMYAAPTNTRYRVHEPKNVALGQTGTGRMHAAPTNRRGRQVNG